MRKEHTKEKEMSACCGEYNCRRKHPIGIYKGDFSGCVYVATRMSLVSDRGDGTGTYEASERHDITRQMKKFIRDNANWVKGIIEEKDDG
jgi:hypothetical protein